MIKSFYDFVRDGIVKKQTPDRSRANFLITETEKSYSFLGTLLKSINLNDENANSLIKLSYDIIMELIRAKMLKDGYGASGQGAHEAEVAYLKTLGINEREILFADQLRFFRNGIMYYGKILDKEYAEKVLEFVNKLYPKLKALVKDQVNL